MAEDEVRAARLIGFAVAFGIALALERSRPHARLEGSWRVNAGLWLAGAVVTGVVCGACVCLAARWAASNGIGLLNTLSAPLVIGTTATLLALDLVSWGWHRANHAVPILWRFHRVHHSDETFTVSTALRFHPGELLASMPLRLAAVVLIGAPVEAVVVFEIAFTLSNLVEHGDISLPLGLERVLAGLFVTPALHRRHHSILRAELDSNFGTVFSFWDRAFGTYLSSTSAERVQTGIPGDRHVPSLGQALRFPFERA